MGDEDVKITPVVARVLRAFLLGDPAAIRYGMDLIKETGIQSGSLYPVLARLERGGYLLSDLEDIDPKLAGRPQRRNYRLNPDRAERARLEVAAFAEQFALPRAANGISRRRLAGA